MTYVLRYNEDKSRLKLNTAADVNRHNNFAYTVYQIRKAVRGLKGGMNRGAPPVSKIMITAGTGDEGRTSG